MKWRDVLLCPCWNADALSVKIIIIDPNGTGADREEAKKNGLTSIRPLSRKAMKSGKNWR
jgi:hypothetical protein